MQSTTTQKKVTITYRDGEEQVERHVDEVHNEEDRLFLRRYGKPGTVMDQEDIGHIMVEDEAL